MTSTAPHLPALTPHLRLAEPREVAFEPAKPRTKPYAVELQQSRAGRAYLAELQRIEPLSREEERNLGLQVEKANRSVLQALLDSSHFRIELRNLLQDASAHSRLDAVLDESPGDDVARVRVAKVLNALQASDHEAALRWLSDIRLARKALDPLVDSAVRSDPSLAKKLAPARAAAASAKRELVRRHLWLALTIAARHPSRGLDLLDRIQEGNVGLMRAVERFRVRKGFRFATYAAWWVRQAINRAAAEQGHCVRLPLKTLEAAHRTDRVQQRFNARTGLPASELHVAHALSVSVDRLREVRRGVSEPVLADDPEAGLASAETSPEHAVAALERARVIEQQLDSLDERERRVLELRFGFHEDEEMSRDEVAQVFSLTRERIRQIENRAVERLAHPTRACILEAV